MYHDQNIVDLLSVRQVRSFDGHVFRATRTNADPTAPSSSGGRWAPAGEPEAGFLVLYTGLERDGAIAEVGSFLADQNPPPREQPVKVSRLAVTARRTLTLLEADLSDLGVSPSKYGERDYHRTQQIGAALIFLGHDGLLAPSARWNCQNLMLFADNHALNERLEVVSSEEVGWRAWAVQHGLLTSDNREVR